MELGSSPSVTEACEVIRDCRKRSVLLHYEGPDRLIMDYRPGSLTPDLDARVKAARQELVWMVIGAMLFRCQDEWPSVDIIYE